MIAKKKRYSFENLSDPQSWRDAGSYIQPNVPVLRFTTKPNEGYRTLHEAFEDAARGEEIVASYQKAKKTEQIRIHVEEVGKLRTDLDSIKKKIDSLNQILELAPSPEISNVPTFKQDEWFPGCKRKAIAAWSPPTAGLLSAQGSLITGLVVTDEVNKNGWRLKTEDLDYVAEKLAGRQIRLRHTDSPRDVVGKVLKAWRDGNAIKFSAEIDPGETDLIRKIQRGYLDAVSIQVLARAFICSECGKPTRDEEGHLIHKCENAHQVVEGPEPLEISLVTQGAYDQAVITEVGN